MYRGRRTPQFAADDRAVTVAITHVLTVGIATVLITGLLFGAGTMLDTQREDSTEASLEVIGERLAGDIASADRMANDSTLTIRTEHQRVAGGSPYTVTLHEDAGDCGPLIENVSCIQLDSNGEDVSVFVPIVTNTPLADGSSVASGPLIISVEDDEITLEEP